MNELSAIWIPLIIGLSLGLLQPVNGTIVAWQWAHFMHGFERAREGTRWTAGAERER